jgi:hypothetical protein
MNVTMSLVTAQSEMTTIGPTISPYDDYLFTTIIFVIHHILDPCILCIGLVGNILAFNVLHLPQYRNQTTCLYMRILTVFDTSVILLKNIPVKPPCIFLYGFIITTTHCHTPFGGGGGRR